MVTFTGGRHAECGPHNWQEWRNICYPMELPLRSAYGEPPQSYSGTDDPGPASWMGSLVEGSRDFSGLMYRRNRYLDGASGQFTQVDPIGFAGGMNLYGYANGDPVSYSDPYGLKVCYAGTFAERAMLRMATEQATNTSITLDREQRCIARATPNARNQNASFRSLQRRLNRLSSSSRVVTVSIDAEAEDSEYFNNHVRIRPVDFSGSYNTNSDGYLCYMSPENSGVRSAGQLMAHELLGHAAAPRLKRYVEARAIDVENEYLSATGQPLRCRQDPQ
jgi:RHS repeat-associated protein